MTIDEKLEILHDSIKSLENIAVAHQASIEDHETSIEAHDRQIDGLLKTSEENARNWEQLRREWQAYLNTLPRQ
jgi:chromosome segregation ATPase